MESIQTWPQAVAVLGICLAVVGVVWAIIEIAQRVFGAGGPTAGG